MLNAFSTALCLSTSDKIQKIVLWLILTASVASASLHEACIKGSLEKVRDILSNKKADINSYDAEGFTPLARLIQDPTDQPEVREQIADLLFKEALLNVNRGDSSGDSPLHMAIRKRNSAFVNRLLEDKRIRLNMKVAKNMPYCTPLLTAIKGTDTKDDAERGTSLQILKTLLNLKDLDVNMNCEGVLPLTEIVKIADNEAISLFLDKQDLLVNARDKDGNGVLHAALQHCSINSAFKMLSKITNVNFDLQDKNGNTALHLAFSSLHNPKICELFIKSMDYNSFMEVVYEITLKIEDYSLNICNDNGETPLHVLFKTLMTHEIPNDRQGPIFHSLSNILFKFKSHSQQDRDGNTVSHLFLLLIAKDKVQDMTDDAHYRFKIFAQIVDDNRYDINLQNNQGQTLLHLTAGVPADHPHIGRSLFWILSRPNFDPNLLDKNGLTALQEIFKNGNEKMIDVIFDRIRNEEALLRFLEYPEGISSIESNNERRFSSRGLLNLSISKNWVQATSILLENPKFGYDEEIFKRSRNFLKSAVLLKNAEIIKMIWKRYESHFKIAADDPFLEEMLESGSLVIYQFLKGHGCPVGGKEEYSLIDWAAKHGWIDVLRENRLDIHVNDRLLKIIFNQQDKNKRDAILDLLLEDPQKIDVCKIISEKTVALSRLCGTLNEKLLMKF